jgi:hypothetical protein
MAKNISDSQKIGQMAVTILNCKLIYDLDSRIEFAFVEIPQQHDYGLDGFLNIFDKKKFQNITPFVQVKGTNTEIKNKTKTLGYKISISVAEWNDLKSKKELSILIGINTKTREVRYVFPKFEDKPTSLYLQNFPHTLDNNQQSKKDLWQKIKEFQAKITTENQQELNSISLSKGKNIPLINGFEAKITDSGLAIVHAGSKAVNINLSSKFKDPEEKKEFREQFTLYGMGLKDKIIFPKDKITNLEQLNGWELGDQAESLAGDIVFSRPPYYTGPILLQTNSNPIELDANYYFSVESQSMVIESILSKDEACFWFHIDSKGCFSYQINRNKISSPLKLFSIYGFLNSLSSEEVTVKLKKGFGFKEIYTFKVDEIIPKEIDYDLLRCFAEVESAFSNTLLEKNIQLNLPEKHNESDRKAICVLGLTLNNMEFYVVFEDKDQYEKGKELRPEGRMDNLYKYVTFQDKIITIIAGGYGQFVSFEDEIQVACFKINHPEYIYLKVAETDI